MGQCNKYFLCQKLNEISRSTQKTYVLQPHPWGQRLDRGKFLKKYFATNLLIYPDLYKIIYVNPTPHGVSLEGVNLQK